MAVLDVEIYSDVVCPWCYVGHRRLEKAVELLAGRHELQVTWKPFQLNPWMPAEGIERAEYRRMKFGDAQRSAAIDQRLTAVAREEGIEMAFDKIHRTPNTIDAHRVIWLARERGIQIPVVEALFKAYFEDGKDIGDRSTLAEVAAAAGLDAEETRRFLDSEEGLAETEAEESVGRSLGIDGVPFFLFEGKYGVSGAQPAEVLVDVIQRVVELEKKTVPILAGVATGDACSLDNPENC